MTSIIEEIESSRKQSSVVGNMVKAFGFSNNNVADEKIISLIQNYNVPNTKEDVMEFMIWHGLRQIRYVWMMVGQQSQKDIGIRKEKIFLQLIEKRWRGIIRCLFVRIVEMN